MYRIFYRTSKNENFKSFGSSYRYKSLSSAKRELETIKHAFKSDTGIEFKIVKG